MINNGSVNKTLCIIVLLALLPATALLVFSGFESRETVRTTAWGHFDLVLSDFGGREDISFQKINILLLAAGEYPGVKELDPEQCLEVSNFLVSQNPRLLFVSVLRPDGIVISKAGSVVDDEGFDEHALFHRATEGSKFTVEPVINQGEDSDFFLQMHIAMPIYDKQNNLRCIILAGYLPIFKNNYIQQLPEGSASIYLTRAGEDSIYVATYDDRKLYPGRMYFKILDKAHVQPELSEIVEKVFLSNSEKGEFEYASDDIQKMVAYKSFFLASKDQSPYMMVITVDSSAIYQSANEIIISCLTFFIIGFGLSLLISVLIEKIVILPFLTKLIDTAKSIIKGNLTVRADVSLYKKELKDLAISFNAMADELEKRNNELTLRRDTANEINRSKSDFFASMSHGIRTPMNSIIGMAYLVQKTNLNEKQQAYVSKIFSAANALSSIINDILDFSKIESGQMSIEQEPFSLEELMDNQIAIFSGKVAEKELELLISIDADVPCELVGDSVRIGQVLTNIINNAIKFTEAGSILVVVSCLEKTEESLLMQITVRDTGIGMTEEQTGQLFTAFAQADGSITRRFGGTGLGLSITRSLLRLMGGDVSITSVAGKGTSVFCTALVQLTDVSEVELPIKEFVGLKVLVIDKTKEHGELFANYLAALGFASRVCIDISDARKILECDEDVFVFLDTDVLSPYVFRDLYTLQEYLQGRDSSRIILTSSTNSPESWSLQDVSGISGVLFKPFHKENLIDMLQYLLADNLDNSLDSTESQDLADLEDSPQDLFLKDVHVLLVEDNLVNQQMMSEILEDAGAKVTVVTSGAEAILCLYSYDINPMFSLVLMDLQMQEMDGFEATRRIRTDSFFYKLPIVAISAHAMDEDKRKCFESGMDDHIAKPLDITKFYEVVTRWGRGRSNFGALPEKYILSLASSPETIKGACVPLFPNSNEHNIRFIPELNLTVDSEAVVEELKKYKFDTTAALACLNNDFDLYKRILLRFVNFCITNCNFIQNPDSSATLRRDRFIYILEFQAISMGRVLLRDLCKIIGDMIITGQYIQEDLLARCYEEICRTYEDICRSFLAASGICLDDIEVEQDTNSNIQEDVLSAENRLSIDADVLEELKVLLDDDDGEAVRFFEINKVHLIGFISNEDLKLLDTYIMTYNYPDALALVMKYFKQR